MSVAYAYATDEDMRVRLGADFLHLTPADQRVAEGADGVFSPSDRWTLTSAATDFVNQGVASGMVCVLSTRISPGTPSPFGGTGQALAVDGCSSVTPHDLLLRRIGSAVGAGQPPGPIAGVSGVTFSVATLAPQIEDASYELNRRFGVDPRIPGRTPGDFYDMREVRQATILTVARRQYLAMARASGSSSTSGDFWDKATAYKAELDDVLARLVVHWRSATGFGAEAAEPSTSRFGTRLSR